MPPIRVLIVALAVGILLIGCKSPEPSSPPSSTQDPSLEPESAQDLLIATLQEIEALSDYSGAGTSGKSRLLRLGADTTYVYGEITPEGYGAVVSERHTRPRGVPLITVRKSHGEGGGGVVSEVRQYATTAAFQNDQPAQVTITTVQGLSRDTILTHIVRNGLLETYTFDLPVVTTTIDPVPEYGREVRRFGRDGEVAVETYDGLGRLLQTRRTAGWVDGSLVVRTEYPDNSWRVTRTLGRADGSILRETTTSEP